MRKFVKAFAILSAVLMLASCGNLNIRKPEKKTPAVTGSVSVPTPWSREAAGSSQNVPDDYPYATLDDVGQIIVVLFAATPKLDENGVQIQYQGELQYDYEPVDVLTSTRSEGQETITFNDIDVGLYRLQYEAFLISDENEYLESKKGNKNQIEDVYGVSIDFCGPCCAFGATTDVFEITADNTKEVDVMTMLMWETTYVYDIGNEEELVITTSLSRINPDGGSVDSEELPEPAIWMDETPVPLSSYEMQDGTEVKFCGWLKDYQIPEVLTSENYGTYASYFASIHQPEFEFTPSNHTVIYAVWCEADDFEEVFGAIEAAN